ncbi:MAG: SurA N-terminal domain-containing protein [Dethiobacteria bacterium]
MLKRFSVLLLAMLCWAAAAGCGSGQEMVAEVNGKPILLSQFNYHYQLAQKKVLDNEIALTPEIVSLVKQQVMENLIFKEVILQEAAARKIEISDKVVDKELNSIIDLFEDEDAFEAHLKNSNLTRESIRREIWELLVIQALVEQVSADPEVDEETADLLLENYLEGIKGDDKDDPSKKIDEADDADEDEESLKLSLREKVLDQNIDVLVGLYFRNLVEKADVNILIEF